MNNVFDFIKRIRKQKHIDRNYAHRYAFVGIGNHSINNLYPVLSYLNVPLKYIVVKSRQTAEVVNKNYGAIIGTVDYETVLNDPEIGGVFICAAPQHHFSLVKSALLKHKNVFVEKPPCMSTSELEQLTEIRAKSDRICLIGFQKRYSRCAAILKKRLPVEKIISYNYRFLTGAYPEGDVYRDLFVHPIDLATYLFGEPELISTAKTEQSKGQTTLFLQLRHKNVVGNIEISSQYAWNQATEDICINTVSGVYRMENFQSLVYKPKPKTLFSIPTEKIRPQFLEQQHLYNTNDFLPVFQNNTLVSHGYFDEIKTFVDLCENRKTKNLSTLEMIKPVFEIIEKTIIFAKI